MGLEDIYFMEILIIIVSFLIRLGIAAIPASLAAKKGYSGVAFYFFGLFMFVPAVIVAAVIQDKRQQTIIIPQYYYPPNYYPPNGYPQNYYPPNGYPQNYPQQNGYPQYNNPQNRIAQSGGYRRNGSRPQTQQNRTHDTDYD